MTREQLLHLDISPDGETWTNLDTRAANHGGFGGNFFDISEFVAGFPNSLGTCTVNWHT